MRTALIAMLVVVSPVLSGGGGLAAQEAAPETAAGRWEQLLLPDAGVRVRDIGVDADGSLWVLTPDGLLRWTATGFAAPRPAPTGSPKGIDMLVGGWPQPLYLGRPTKERGVAALFRLRDGGAKEFTRVGYDPGAITRAGHKLGVYVSESGRLHNWGNRFLAVLTAEGWKRTEAKLDLTYVIVFDTGRRVYFFYPPWLYGVSPDGEFTERRVGSFVKVKPAPGPLFGYLWGDTNALVVWGNGMHTFDLRSGEPVPVSGALMPLPGPRPAAVRPGGPVPELAVDVDRATRTYVFKRLWPSGKIGPVVHRARPAWEPGEQSALRTVDGAFWRVIDDGEVERRWNESVRTYGWEEGLALHSTAQLAEGPEGRIYAADFSKVYVFLPELPPVERPPRFRRWEEFSPIHHRPIRDGEGNVWLFLEAHPGKVSRWDGSGWRHFEVPFDTTRVHVAVADDRGHLLVRGGVRSEWFDLHGGTSREFPDLRAILRAAVADGARTFYDESEEISCYVTEEGRIWCADRQGLHYFDGERWDRFGLASVESLCRSAGYPVIARVRQGKHFAYDRGQMVLLQRDQTTPGRWLIGPDGVQPYEEELLDAFPDTYLPLEEDEDGRYFLLRRDEGEPDGSDEDRFVRTDEIPTYAQRLVPAFSGGHWLQTSVGVPEYRILARRAFRCELDPTPLRGMKERVDTVFDDAAGNLWFAVRHYRGGARAILKRMSDFRLSGEALPVEARASLDIGAAALVEDGRDPGDLQLFWRIDGGEWTAGHERGKARIGFRQPGRRALEIAAMDLQGGLSVQNARLQLEASVTVPETVLEGPSEQTVRDVTWKPPVKLVPSAEGAAPHLAYRLDGGEWRKGRADGSVLLGGVAPGEHRVEIAAQEPPDYADPTPVVLSMTYAPDYDLMVEQRVDELSGPSPLEARRAIQELRAAGPQVIPALRRRMAEIRRQMRLAERLGELLEEFETVEEAP